MSQTDRRCSDIKCKHARIYRNCNDDDDCCCHGFAYFFRSKSARSAVRGVNRLRIVLNIKIMNPLNLFFAITSATTIVLRQIIWRWNEKNENCCVHWKMRTINFVKFQWELNKIKSVECLTRTDAFVSMYFGLVFFSFAMSSITSEHLPLYGNE